MANADLLIYLFYCIIFSVHKGEKMDPRNGRPAQVILALAFGCRKSGAGLSNHALGIALNISHKMHPNLPIMVQSEFIPPMKGDWVPEIVVGIHQVPGKYLDTREVLAQMASVCLENDLRCAIIIAHPDHQWRVVRAARKLGFESIVPSLVELDVPYDPESVQWWTRNRFLFWIRETPVIAYYWIRGWI